jgi:hypothetical protein
MKTKTKLIILLVIVLLCIIGYFIFPLAAVMFKIAIGLIALLLILLGVFIGRITKKN